MQPSFNEAQLLANFFIKNLHAAIPRSSAAGSKIGTDRGDSWFHRRPVAGLQANASKTWAKYHFTERMRRWGVICTSDLQIVASWRTHPDVCSTQNSQCGVQASCKHAHTYTIQVQVWRLSNLDGVRFHSFFLSQHAAHWIIYISQEIDYARAGKQAL